MEGPSFFWGTFHGSFSKRFIINILPVAPWKVLLVFLEVVLFPELSLYRFVLIGEVCLPAGAEISLFGKYTENT